MSFSVGIGVACNEAHCMSDVSRLCSVETGTDLVLVRSLVCQTCHLCSVETRTCLVVMGSTVCQTCHVFVLLRQGLAWL